MNSASTLGSGNKDWGNRKKRKSRQESIFDKYREIMGHNSLPPDKQYWTLCGKHTSPYCELPHALADGIITPNQFHGVDRVKDIITHNRKIYPEANWYEGEFDRVIDQVDGFTPGLVNLDTVHMTEKASILAAQVLFVLVSLGASDCLLAVNHLLNNPREHNDRCQPPDYFTDRMNNISAFQNVMSMAFRDGWRDYHMEYVYGGADDHSNSIMHTVYFYKA